MRPTTLHIFFSVPDKPVFFSSLHQFQTIEVVSYCILSQSLHENSIKFGLVEIQWFGLRKILQQIVYFFVVDLQKGTVNIVALSFVRLILFDLLE